MRPSGLSFFLDAKREKEKVEREGEEEEEEEEEEGEESQERYGSLGFCMEKLWILVWNVWNLCMKFWMGVYVFVWEKLNHKPILMNLGLKNPTWYIGGVLDLGWLIVIFK